MGVRGLGFSVYPTATSNAGDEFTAKYFAPWPVMLVVFIGLTDVDYALMQFRRASFLLHADVHIFIGLLDPGAALSPPPAA